VDSRIPRAFTGGIGELLLVENADAQADDSTDQDEQQGRDQRKFDECLSSAALRMTHG